MLDIVRNKQKSFLIKIAFAIIILSFVIGYAMMTSPGGNDNGDPAETVAVVNDTPITYAEFQTAYGNLYQLYKNIYQDQFTPALERQLMLAEKTVNGLIEQVLLLEEAKRLDLAVTETELVEAIAAIPAFQDAGVFNKERYLQVLNYQRLTPEEFETMQRRDLLTAKVREHLQAGITVSDAEIEEEFRINNETVNLDFVRLAPELFESKVKINTENLATFFEAHQEEFRVPERVSLRYLQFDPDRYRDGITFDDAELDKYYRRHLDQFDVPEQVKASHILIRVDQDADQAVRDKKRAFAADLLAQAQSGKDFAELARTHSDDKGSALKGGDLGFFTRGTMVPAFEDAAFNLNPGEISKLVETPFGFHIIKTEAYIEAGVKPLEDVIDVVKAGLAEEKAVQHAFEMAMDAYNVNRKTGNLQTAAEANDLGIKETGLFARDESIDGIGANQDVINAAFQLDEQALARPVRTARGVLLFTLKDRVASHIPELENVKTAVETAYRKVESIGLARAAADQLLTDLTAGGNLVKLAEKAKLKAEETGPFARTYAPFVPRIGSSSALSDSAFAQTEGEQNLNQVFNIDDRFYVVSVKARQAADMNLLDENKRSELQQFLQNRKQNDAVQTRVEALRAASVIQISPGLKDLLDKEKQS